jgi:hypothetical protein
MHHQQLVLVVNSTSLLASCPVCQTSSRQVHSYYTRTIADLCWADRQVRLELHVRRFVCSNTACSRRTFAEQFGEQGKRVCSTDKALRISVANHWSHAGRRMLAHVWPRLKGYPSVQIPFSGWFEPLTCQNDRRAARPWCGRFCASERSEVRHHPAEFGTSVLGRFAP